MNVERLKLAAKIISNIKLTDTLRFDLHDWYEANECGTVACAIGHLCMNKQINKLGLKLESPSIGSPHCPGSPQKPKWVSLNGSSYYSWNAVKYFFEISDDDAEFLFAPGSYEEYLVTPKSVANRIKRFIKTKNT